MSGFFIGCHGEAGSKGVSEDGRMLMAGLSNFHIAKYTACPQLSPDSTIPLHSPNDLVNFPKGSLWGWPILMFPILLHPVLV